MNSNLSALNLGYLNPALNNPARAGPGLRAPSRPSLIRAIFGISGVSLINFLEVLFTSVANDLDSGNNSYTCKSFIKFDPCALITVPHLSV